MKTIKIERLSISGQILEVGDHGPNHTPSVTIVNELDGSRIRLDIGIKDAQQLAQHLYEDVQLNFDAAVYFLETGAID
jgi:hypothetical protein